MSHEQPQRTLDEQIANIEAMGDQQSIERAIALGALLKEVAPDLTTTQAIGAVQHAQGAAYERIYNQHIETAYADRIAKPTSYSDLAAGYATKYAPALGIDQTSKNAPAELDAAIETTVQRTAEISAALKTGEHVAELSHFTTGSILSLTNNTTIRVIKIQFDGLPLVNSELPHRILLGGYRPEDRSHDGHPAIHTEYNVLMAGVALNPGELESALTNGEGRPAHYSAYLIGNATIAAYNALLRRQFVEDPSSTERLGLLSSAVNFSVKDPNTRASLLNG